MKKLILIVCGLWSMVCYSQDTTKLVNFKMQVRMAAGFASLLSSDDDLLYSLRKADKLAGFPSLTDSITVDTLLVTDVTMMYDGFYGYSFSIGEKVIPLFQNHFVAARLQNSNMERQMAAVETKWNNSFLSLRQQGLQRLRRKN